MKRSLLIAVCVSAVLLAPINASAAKPEKCLVVNTTSGGAFHDLQVAVDAAASRDALKLKGTCHTVRGGIHFGKDLTVTGQSNNGFGPATVAFEFDGVGRSAVIRIDAGANVTLTGLTIPGCVGGFQGGGITVGGMLVLDDSLVSGNSAYVGAGIAIATTGNVTLNRTRVANNGALYGGGIENQGTLSVNDSVIAENDAILDGGGIANYGGKVAITGSVISGNRGGTGGGIYTSGGSVAITGTSITGNTACNGGGIYNLGSTLTIVNSVLTPNVDTCGT
jgi:hypothetical protein